MCRGCRWSARDLIALALNSKNYFAKVLTLSFFVAVLTHMSSFKLEHFLFDMDFISKTL